jgi:hypothetical protein
MGARERERQEVGHRERLGGEGAVLHHTVRSQYLVVHMCNQSSNQRCMRGTANYLERT